MRTIRIPSVCMSEIENFLHRILHYYSQVIASSHLTEVAIECASLKKLKASSVHRRRGGQSPAHIGLALLDQFGSLSQRLPA